MLTLLNRAVDGFVVRGIHGYQKHISPRKGFRCAHRVYHGGVSCSEYIRRAIVAHGLRGTCPLARERFAQCRQAAQKMRAARAASIDAAGMHTAGAQVLGTGSCASDWWDRLKREVSNWSPCDACDVGCCVADGIGEIGDCSACDCSGCSW